MSHPALTALMAGKGGPPPPFDPLTSIAWHSVFWGDNPNQSLADGATVSSWTNSGSSGLPATNVGSSSTKPTYQLSSTTLNNRAGVNFDTSNDVLGTATFTAIPQPFSVVLVGTYGSSGSDGGVDVGGSSIVRVGRTASWFIDAGVRLTGPSFTLSLHAAFAVFDGAVSRIIVDNAAPSVGDAGTNSAQDVNLNESFPGGKRAFVGLYPGDITAHPRWADLKAWITDYYGLAT